jgi:hypothetical protein
MLNGFLDVLVEQANLELVRRHGDPRRASDTEAELELARGWVRTLMPTIESRILPIFEVCIERNDCPGWPRFERLSLRREESIYGESRYNPIATAYAASSIDLCGVRVGSDKTTHLLSHGFFYYNASRRPGEELETEEDALRLASAEERGLVGARATGVVSGADAEATAAGFRFFHDLFLGDDPALSRSAASGLLARRRAVDLCAYVRPSMDEALNPPDYTGSPRRTARLRAAIARRAAGALAEGDASVVHREPDPRHHEISLLTRVSLIVKHAFTYLTMPREQRAGTRFLVFPNLKLERRRPIVLHRLP